MRTIIEQDQLGHINLVVDGSEAPENVLQKFQILQKALFPVAETEAKPPAKVSKKEVA